MKRRWLIGAWILALLSLGAGVAPASAECAPEPCCCCSDTVELCCGCGCEVSPAPLPVTLLPSSQLLAPDFAPLQLTRTHEPSPRTAVTAAPPPLRSPRQLAMLAGCADWRGPPGLF